MEYKISKSWSRGFEVARIASMHSTGTTFGQKLGAALYAGSNLLSIGFNDINKTHKFSVCKEYNGNTHAEVKCLIKRWHYEKSNNLILYVSRIITNSDHTIMNFGCSRPCAKCMKVIIAYGIKRVRFYNERGIPEEIKL